LKNSLTHISDKGDAQMVDVSQKSVTVRRACARGFLRLSAATVELIRSGNGPKGEVFGVARIAGILAAKRTDELIPMCHTLGLDHCDIRFGVEGEVVAVEVVTSCRGATGVEMEALVAVHIALATLHDMVKAIEPEAVAFGVHVAWKEGGKKGFWEHANPPLVLDDASWN
jgi:cyclic pyranopterin phosphate synthase